MSEYPKTAREIWHALRRASTKRYVIYAPTGEPTRTEYRRVTNGAYVPYIRVKRGKAGLRDFLAHQLLERNRWLDWPRPQSLEARLNAYLVTKGLRIINQRGLSTPAGWGPARVQVRDHQPGLTLIAGEYEYKYSRRAGSWRVGGAYLFGTDDAGEWAIRVPRDTKTIRSALAWATPAKVLEAEREGRDVRRQGDVFFVPLKRGGSNFQALTAQRHEVRQRRDGGYTVVHPEHRPLRLPRGAWRAYMMRQDAAHGGGGD